MGAGSALGRGRPRQWLEPTHFWSTKMPTMRVKEIRSAVTHMRQYSSGGCGQTARGQPQSQPVHIRLQTEGPRAGEDLEVCALGIVGRGGEGVCVCVCVHRIKCLCGVRSKGG